MSQKLIEKRDAALAEMRTLAESEDIDQERFDELDAQVQDLNHRIKVLSAHTRSGSTEDGSDKAPQYMKRTNTDVDIRIAGRGEVRDAALAILEREHSDQVVPVSDPTAVELESMFGRRAVTEDGEVLFDGDAVARRFLATETPAYRSAFQKGLRYSQPAWNADEVQALEYFRAAEQSLTSASGGYGVPILIDPTVIITSGAGDAPILSVSRVERITTSAWKGVTSTGVVFNNEVESDPIAAQQATLVQPSITAHKIAAVVPFTVEIEGDYPNFAGEMQRLIEQAYVDYLAVKTMTGTGTIEPFGIFTAIDATAGSEVAVTTDGQLGPADALKVWAQLPERARARSTWLSSVTVQNQFRNNGTTDAFFSTDLTQNNIATMLGRRYILSDYAPAFSGTTGASNLAIVGAFENYVIAQRVGMSVELIPHVFDGDGLWKGQRAWAAWARVGADSIDDNAFRLLQNT